MADPKHPSMAKKTQAFSETKLSSVSSDLRYFNIEKAPTVNVCYKIAEELLQVSEGIKAKLSEEDFLTAVESSDFGVVTEAFARVLHGDNVALKLQRLYEHNYLCCGLMTPSIKMPGHGDHLEMIENATNIKLGLKCVSLLEHLINMQVKEGAIDPEKLKQTHVGVAYLVALSLPYIDVKTELFYEVEAIGSTLTYEQLRFSKETERKAFLNMLVTVDHLRNGHSSVLKKHN